MGPLVDCVLNRTLIDADTNRRIGKRPPSSYMTEIQQMLANASAASLEKVLESHLLPAAESGDVGPLATDDFSAFTDSRQALLCEAIVSATGHPMAEEAPLESGVSLT